ncbi:hypothetical protein H9M94_01460 [Mycoplasma sp. Pen4]|uniref:MAG4270 family putative restriction endonuclease n=1 Tax=Mycoplasma sp. Pen4 TaxID=640330 RepID=UPI001654BBAB|nr:hypothetical protein [Mycoplasma sp. Pen4]QNM93921.1 hypothetical protein H9M94_01460 [Mycoplasma sp. Pen4]
MSKINIYKIPFTTKNYQSNSNSAKLKFDLYIAMASDKSYIRDIYFDFSEIHVDLMQTASHFKGKHKFLIQRQELFEKEMNLKIEKRPERSAHKIHNLNEEQIRLVENYVNVSYFQDGYTFKGLISLFKGNNPGGSMSKPSSSEIIIDKAKNNGSTCFNLPLLIDSIYLRTVNGNSSLSDFLIQNNYNKDEKAFYSLNDFIKNIKNRDGKIYKLFLELERSSNKNDEHKSNLLKEIRNLRDNYKEETYIINRINAYTQKMRNQFRKNIKQKRIEIFKIPKYSNEEKAHIYAVEWIKDEAMKSWKINKEILTQKEIDDQVSIILKQISDVNNYLNLEPNCHTIFDKKLFTYNKNGELVVLKQEVNIPEYYWQIPKDKLNSEMVEYIQKRNKVLEHHN